MRLDLAFAISSAIVPGMFPLRPCLEAARAINQLWFVDVLASGRQ